MNRTFVESRFQIRDRLGRGGTAEVAKVWARHLKRDAALKYPLDSPDHSPVDFNHLALREHKLIGGLPFPGLVRILECEPAGDYLLLELCSGPTLDSLGKIENVYVACAIISALAVDLEYLRALGIIHGDFKPHNVFLPVDWRQVNDGRLHWVKLSDFSLGRLAGEADDARAGLGTIGYTAPETLAENRTSFQSDIFALGVTAYLMLSGDHPFLKQGSDPVEVSSRVRLDNPPPLASLRADVSEELSDLVAQMMAKEPAHRPQSGWEICSRLRQLGVSYPYERALQPKHMIPAGSAVAALSERSISGSPRSMGRFFMLSGERLAYAKLILTANWRRGMLTYEPPSFRFADGVYWPSIIRRQVSQAWRRKALTKRKSAVRNAVILAAGARLTPDEHADHVDMLSAHLFSGLLSIATVKRISRKLAAEREGQSSWDDAARLYIQTGDFASAERCALTAVKQYREKHQFAEAQALLHLCIDYGRMTRPPEAVCRLFLEHGEIHKEAGESELAEHAFLEITENNSGPDYLIARAYNLLGDIYKAKRLFQPGVIALEKALEIFTRLGNSLEISHVTNNLGNVHSMTGDFRKALSYYRRALHVQRRLGLKRDVASTVANLGVVYYFLGHADRALAVLILSLKLKRELGDRGEIARTLNNLGYLAHNQGYHREALEYLTESLALNREIGNQKEILFNLDNLGLVMLRSARLSDCLAYLKEGVRLALDLSDLSHLAAFTTQMGQVLLRMGQIREALQAADDAQGHLNGISDGEIRAYLYRLRAEIQYLLGQPAEAAGLLRAGIEEKEIVGLAPARLALLTTLARINLTPEEESEACSLAEQLQVKDFATTLAIEKMESALALGDLSAASILADRLAPVIDAEVDEARHIDSTRTLISLGDLKLQAGDLESASKYLARASAEARETGLLPEMITSHILLGQVLFAQKEYEQCYQHCRNALELGKRMLSGVDQAFQISFQKTRQIQRLATMIGRLGTILTKKERAG